MLMADDRGHTILDGRSNRCQLPRHHFPMFEAYAAYDPSIAPLPGHWRVVRFTDGLHEPLWDASLVGLLIHSVGMVRDTDQSLWEMLVPWLETEFRLSEFISRRHAVGIHRPSGESVLIDFITHVEDVVFDVFEEDLLNVENKRQRILMFERNLKIRTTEGIKRLMHVEPRCMEIGWIDFGVR